MKKDFIKIGDMFVPIDKIDYYYPIGKETVLTISIAGKEISCNMPTTKALKEIVSNLNQALCNKIIDVNPKNII